MPVQDVSQAADAIDQPIDGAEDVQEQTTEEVSAEDGQQPEQTFTRAEVQAMLADFEKKMESRVQSQVARSENRTNQRIQERLAFLEQNRETLSLTDEAYAAAQDKIISEEQKRSYLPQKPTGNEFQQAAPSPEEYAMFVDDQVQHVYEATGFKVTPDMPEYKEIEAAYNDPHGSLPKLIAIATRQSMKAAERVQALKQGAKGRLPGGGEGRSSNGANYDPNKPASYYLEQAAKANK